MQERVPALVFTVHGRLYGLLQDGGASLLPWLRRYDTPGPVPGVPSWTLGLLSVQGTVQAIADLGAFLGHGTTIPAEDSRLVFVEAGDLRVGLLVDAVSGIRYFDSIEYAVFSEAEPYVAGHSAIHGQQIRILDGVNLLQAIARALGSPLAGRA